MYCCCCCYCKPLEMMAYSASSNRTTTNVTSILRTSARLLLVEKRQHHHRPPRPLMLWLLADDSALIIIMTRAIRGLGYYTTIYRIPTKPSTGRPRSSSQSVRLVDRVDRSPSTYYDLLMIWSVIQEIHFSLRISFFFSS